MPLRLFSKETLEALREALDSRSDAKAADKSYWASVDLKDNTFTGLADDFKAIAHTLAESVSNNGKNKDRLIVEPGCGDGRVTEALLKSGYNAVGVDLSKHRSNVLPAERFREGSHEHLPFEDASVHGVISVCAFTYADRDESAQELHRILVPGGKAMLVLHHPEQLAQRLADKYAKHFNGNPDVFDAYYRVNARRLALREPAETRCALNLFENEWAIRRFFESHGFRIMGVVGNATIDKKTPWRSRALTYGVALEKPLGESDVKKLELRRERKLRAEARSASRSRNRPWRR